MAPSKKENQRTNEASAKQDNQHHHQGYQPRRVTWNETATKPINAWLHLWRTLIHVIICKRTNLDKRRDNIREAEVPGCTSPFYERQENTVRFTCIFLVSVRTQRKPWGSRHRICFSVKLLRKLEIHSGCVFFRKSKECTTLLVIVWIENVIPCSNIKRWLNCILFAICFFVCLNCWCETTLGISPKSILVFSLLSSVTSVKPLPNSVQVQLWHNFLSAFTSCLRSEVDSGRETPFPILEVRASHL